MNDSYMHVDNNVMYVEESIPGPPESSKEYEALLNDFNSQLTNFCSCRDICSNSCRCLSSSGGKNYVCDDDYEYLKFKLDYELKDFKKYPILECNKFCQCSSKCGNRVVQYGPIEGLVIKTCEPKGLGLYTTNCISKGAFVCEYAGEIITKAQAITRQIKNKKNGKMNYIYCLNEHSKGKVIQTFIDPSYFGNIGRYMNHSCRPNCEIIPVRVNCPIPKLAIFGKKNILPNTELTFDYGSGDFTNESKQFTVETGNKMLTENNRKKCFCNSENCKGVMPFETY